MVLAGAPLAMLGRPAHAQVGQGIAWPRNVEQAIAEAKKTQRPILLLVEGTSGRGGGRGRHLYSHSSVQGRQLAFSDRRVIYAARNFVPVAAQRGDSRYSGLFQQLGIGPHAGYRGVFITPDGAKLGESAALEDPARLAPEIAMAFRSYRAQFYKDELKAKFGDPNATVQETRDVLRKVAQMVVEQADGDVLAILDRPGLPTELRVAAYQALADLGTSAAVERLVEDAAGPDAATARLAGQALASAPVGAAEFLLDRLDDDNAAIRLAAYRAITRICEVPQPKSDNFWTNAKEKRAAEELRRVRGLAEQCMTVWKRDYAPYR